MYVQPDTSGLNNIGTVYAAPPIKRAPIAPAQSGDRAQEDRRQNQSGQDDAQSKRAVFQTLLSDATATGLTRELGRTIDAAVSERPDFIRPEKRPDSQPASLSLEDVTAAYSYLSGGQKAAASENANQAKSAVADADRYAAASAAYSQHAFAITPAFAGKGEVLELQA